LIQWRNTATRRTRWRCEKRE